MSYRIAYTTRFRSLDNTLWNIDIYLNEYDSIPLEIKLEGDEPCVIEWQEAGKTDVVQSSTCTLRVSNEKDRQMARLMNRRDAAVLVKRDGKRYWIGFLDDAVYEEPYSSAKSYVTEIIFSDFGFLNRIPFTLTGKQSVEAIVRDCLYPIFGDIGYNLYVSLLEPKTQLPITLDMLYINADRFKSDGESWGDMTSKREVLDEILRPLGLRIMQKNAQANIYDIEYLRDHDNFHDYIVWKGTDAFMKGSETFGWYEVAFDPDADETLASGELDYDRWNYIENDRYYAKSYNPETETDSDIGFYVQTGRYPMSELPVSISDNAKFFRTRAVFTDSSDIGVAWRIVCKDGVQPIAATNILVGNHTAKSLAETEPVFRMETGYLPLVPDRGQYQIRVNLDFLLSFRDNPLDSPPDEWVVRQSWYINSEMHWRGHSCFLFLLPVILELLDDDGNAVCHYKNAEAADMAGLFHEGNIAVVIPLGIGKGKWKPGAAEGFGDMFLAYYKDYDKDDDDRDPLVAKGWVGNRIALPFQNEINGTLYRLRGDGEYLPMPPAAGRMRLTVGSGVFPFPPPYPYHIYYEYPETSWQLYRHPKITLVKAARKDDKISTDDILERDMVQLYADHLKETVKAGCWSKGIAPSARGMFFDARGVVWQKFIKNGWLRTLAVHRLRCIEDQTFYTHPVLSGTAEFNGRFCAYREYSTPGIFLVTALRQDLHQDTEEVTMTRIADVGGFVYEYSWSDPVCVNEKLMEYSFSWSDPVCAKKPVTIWSFNWSSPICSKKWIKTNKDNI